MCLKGIYPLMFLLHTFSQKSNNSSTFVSGEHQLIFGVALGQQIGQYHSTYSHVLTT